MFDKKIFVKNSIIKLLITLLVLPSLNLQAQFTGGSDNCDRFVAKTEITLNGESLNLYFGGNGKGDNQVTLTSVFLNEDVLYQGGNGRGDIAQLVSAQSLGDDMRFSGGSGDGDGSAGIAGKVLSQRILWRGGGVSGKETQSDSVSNWYPNSRVPGINDEVAIEDTANNYNLVLARNMRIKSLDFNGSGKKVVLGNYSLVIAESVIGADSSNYIQTTGTGCARFFIPNTETRIMPIGRSAYNPVTITNNTGVLDSFCVVVWDEILSRGYQGRPLSKLPRVRRTWYINKGSGNSNAGSGVDFVFQFNPGEDTGISSMNLFHWDGSNWAAQTGGSLSSNEFTFTGYMGDFSPFGLGSGVTPLPVSWLDMRCARKGPQTVEVRWKTATEEASQSFYIQRSTGGEFRDIDSMPAAGYSYEPKSYTYTDRSAPAGTLFYRIKQQDMDGSTSYSDICATAQATINELRVMNNPADKEFKVWTSQALEGSAYRLINAAGQEVHSGRLYNGMTEVPTASLASGCYTFQILNAENPFFYKVVVIHP